MHALAIDDEPIDSSGALSVFHAAIDELHRRYEGSKEGMHLGTEELKAPRGLFLVARVDGDLAGGVGVRPIGAPSLCLGEVKRLWVRPDLRRHGIARSLMDAAEARAREVGHRQLYLESGYAQPEALAFYGRTGWTRVEAFPVGVHSYPGAYRFTKVL